MKGKFFCYALFLPNVEVGEKLAAWIAECFNRHPKIADWFTETAGEYYIVGIWEG